MLSSSSRAAGPQAANDAQLEAGVGVGGDSGVLTAEEKANKEFIRAENEDDDGYDPYSDRRPAPEPLFERDPWG